MDRVRNIECNVVINKKEDQMVSPRNKSGGQEEDETNKGRPCPKQYYTFPEFEEKELFNLRVDGKTDSARKRKLSGIKKSPTPGNKLKK
jgi:hypothetical protein